VQAAERQAANLLENSNKQARERARELETRTLAEQQAAEQRLTAVRDERDQIEAYLEQMRELVGRMPLMSSKNQEPQAPAQGNTQKQGTGTKQNSAPKTGAPRSQNG